MLRLCKDLGKTPAELADGLSSEEFAEFMAAEALTAGDSNNQNVPENMDPAEFIRRLPS